METQAECYLLTDSVIYICRMGPDFQELIDDDDSMADKEDGSDERMIQRLRAPEMMLLMRP